ncbi:MAG: XRE family transcriptional regulator [Ktedonobacteraceae bacterium]
MMANLALRRARDQRGWSQERVAQEIGTDARNVGRWERGETIPSPHFRTKLCLLFQVNAQTLGLVVPPHVSSVESDLLPAQIPAPGPIIDTMLPRLTIPMSQIVGREAILNDLLALLKPGITYVLYGLPGVGKTTLAQLLAHHPDRETLFPNGLLWISLGPNPDLHRELLRLVSVLTGTEDEQTKVYSIEELSQYVHRLLGQRRLLIVIDDVWSIQDIQPLLVGGSHVSHVLTTRLPEVAFSVQAENPLRIPELNAEQSRTLFSLLVPYPLDSTNENVRQLLDALGGLPLAITLIGRSLRRQSVGGQRRRIEASLAQLLDASHRLHLAALRDSRSLDPQLPTDIPGSLSTIIQISDSQLSPEAQQGLRALSILPTKPNSFSEAAALAVCGPDAGVLDSLLDAGLLEGAGEGRYWLHQVIADYGRLHSTGREPLERLIHYALQLCTHTTMIDASYMLTLEKEYPMILAALDAATCAQHQEFIHMVLALVPFWRLSGLYEQADYQLQRALALTSASDNDEIGAQLLAHRAVLASLRGDWDHAEQHAQMVLRLPFVSSQQEARIKCLRVLGHVAGYRGERAQERAFYQEALALTDHDAYPEERIRLLDCLATLTNQEGEYPLAETFLQEGLALARQLGYLELICQLVSNLGYLYKLQGYFSSAEPLLREGSALAQQLRYAARQIWLLLNLGVIACEQGDYVQGEALFLQGLTLARRMNDQKAIPRFLMNLGAVASDQNAYERAEQYLQQGLAEVKDANQPMTQVLLLTNLGELRAQVGALQAAQVTLEDCLVRARALDNPWIVCNTLCKLGDLLLQTRQLDAAEDRFEEALRAYRNGEPSRELITQARFGLARIMALRGNVEEARQTGMQCLAIFAEMQHRYVQQTQHWLDELPLSTALSVEAEQDKRL